MGAWVPELRLPPGETVVWRVSASSTYQGLAAGGRLALTSHALVFQPHHLDHGVLGAGPWRIPLTAIAEVGTAPVSLAHLFAGGLRRRMRLLLADGAVVLLVVNRRERLTGQVRAAVAAARG
jgi:hypothetical protein